MEREQQYVGIDLHRRRSVIVRMNDAGEVLEVSKIDNDPVALAMAVAEAGPDPEVALEALLRDGCATRRHVTGWGARTHRWPVAAGR